MLASSTIQMCKFGQKIKNHSTPSLSIALGPYRLESIDAVFTLKGHKTKSVGRTKWL